MKNQGGFLSIILTIVVAMVLMLGGVFIWYKSDMDKEFQKSIPKNKDVVESVNENDRCHLYDNWIEYKQPGLGYSFCGPVLSQDSRILSDSESEFSLRGIQSFMIYSKGGNPDLKTQRDSLLRSYVVEDSHSCHSKGVDIGKNHMILLDCQKDGVSWKNYLVDNGDFVHQIYYRDDMGQFTDDFDRIMQSFEFNNIEDMAVLGSEDAMVDMASWKNYTNNDFGLIFRYPSDDGYDLKIATDKIIIGQEPSGFSMHITKTTKNPTDDTEGTVYSRATKTINDLSYREFWRQEVGNSYGYLLYDENFGQYYIFESTIGPDNELFEKIMETVSFAKVIPPGPAEDWINYKSEEAKISFYYTVDFAHTQNSELFGKLHKSDEGHFWVKVEDDKDLKTTGDIKANYHTNDTYGYGYDESFVNIRGVDIYKQGRYDLGVIEKYYFLNNGKLVTISFEFNFDSKDEMKQIKFKGLISGIMNTIKILDNDVVQDAGKVCNDSSECESYCVADLPEIYLKSIAENGPMEMTGNCAEEQVLKGCFSIVENNFVSGVDCF